MADIAERAIGFMSEQPVYGLAVRTGILKQKNVQLAVIVVVEDGGP